MHHLVLEDGTVFHGVGVGAPGVAAGEACFTTAMTGYEEAVTDPSYVAQVCASPTRSSGPTASTRARMESPRVQCEAVVMHDARPEFAAWLRERASSRSRGSTRARSCAASAEGGSSAAPSATRRSRRFTRGRSPSRRSTGGRSTAPVGTHAHVRRRRRAARRPRRPRLKRSIPRRVAAAGMECIVVPRHTDPDEILDLDPQAVLISNGPGDPAVLTTEVETIRALLGRVPVFGICLGHQLLGLALGHETFKLPFGHRGANHPVRDLATGRVLVTVQNHGFAVAADDDVSHVSLNDGTCEGLVGDGFASVQFHPEAAPGPLDALPFFDRIADACRSAPTFARS